MNPDFQCIFDPLISELLSIVERADQCSIETIRVQSTTQLNKANDAFEVSEFADEWKYCHYAISVWLDEEITVHHHRWSEKPLEAHYFASGYGFTKFFERAQSAFERHHFNAYEVFYICFMFGFHGVYQNGDKTAVPDGLPSTDTDWQKQASDRLAQIHKRKSSGWNEVNEAKLESMPLVGASSLISNTILLGFVLAALTIAIFIRMRLG